MACRRFIASEFSAPIWSPIPAAIPTSAILALAPLLRAGAILPRGIIVDSKSGVSGAGRDPKAHLHFPECNESVSAYGVGTHRHMPEIDQVLTDVADSEIRVVFTPHLIPMDRGILSTCYAEPTGEFDDKSLLDVIKNFYANERFVRVTPMLPTTKQVSGTNFCDITVRTVRGRVVVISAIDNLIKGASGAAVQNFNLMHGFEQKSTRDPDSVNQCNYLHHLQSAKSHPNVHSSSTWLPSCRRLLRRETQRCEARFVACCLRSAGRGGGRVHQESGVRGPGENRPRADAERFDPSRGDQLGRAPTPAPATRAMPTRGKWRPGRPRPAARRPSRRS